MSTTKVEDVAAALGRPIASPETEQVQKWIDRVEQRIRNRIVDLSERLSDDAYLDTFTGVVEDVVIRKIHNPEGMRSERIDDYYYDRGEKSSDLWPTEQEWAELLPASSVGAFSTRPGFEPGW
ncbi:MAG TPA: hypothetical protein VIG71_10770 [Enteractinococcus sp.]